LYLYPNALLGVHLQTSFRDERCIYKPCAAGRQADSGLCTSILNPFYTLQFPFDCPLITIFWITQDHGRGVSCDGIFNSHFQFRESTFQLGKELLNGTGVSRLSSSISEEFYRVGILYEDPQERTS
jgi:hypothetical protein